MSKHEIEIPEGWEVADGPRREVDDTCGAHPYHMVLPIRRVRAPVEFKNVTVTNGAAHGLWGRILDEVIVGRVESCVYDDETQEVLPAILVLRKRKPVADHPAKCSCLSDSCWYVNPDHRLKMNQRMCLRPKAVHKAGRESHPYLGAPGCPVHAGPPCTCDERCGHVYASSRTRCSYTLLGHQQHYAVLHKYVPNPDCPIHGKAAAG